MKFSEIEWKRPHETAPDRSLVWGFPTQRFVFASEIIKGYHAGSVLLTTSDGYAGISLPVFAADRAEELCVELDPPKPDPLADLTGRLNAHEERIDDLCRQIAELREMLRPAVVASKDVAPGDAVYSPPAAQSPEQAALEFVQELQKLASPVDVVSGPSMWTLTRRTRTVRVIVESDRIDAFYLDVSDLGQGWHVFVGAIGSAERSLRTAADYLRGA